MAKQPTTRLINMPQRIARLEGELLSMRTDLKKLYEERERALLPIDRKIAFELNECKNKEQREVKKTELLWEDETYQNCVSLIAEKELEIAEKEIQLKMLERQFSVEKLTARWTLGFQYSVAAQMFGFDDDVTVNNGSDRV